jgi:hypothetical protein
MGLPIVLVAMLFVFFIRDIQLLVAGPRSGLPAKLAAYGACNAIYLTSLTAILSSTGVHHPFQFVQASPAWLVSVLCHGFIWLFCMNLKRTGRSGLCWLATLFPTPVLLFSMATGTLLASPTISIGVVPLAFVVALCWWTAVVIAVTRIQAVATAAFETRFAIDYAGVANTTALVLIPISGVPLGF